MSVIGAIGQLGSIAGGGSHMPLGRGASSAWEQMQNRVYPSAFPDITSVMAAYQRGWISWDIAAKAAGSSGVNLGQNRAPALGDRAAAWKGIFKLMESRPDAGLIMMGRQRGIIPEAEFAHLSERAGMNKPDWVMIQPLLRGYCSPAELLMLRNRGTITEQTFRDKLQRVGGFEGEELSYFKELLKVYPTTTDLVQWAVREAFSPAIANKHKLYYEHPTDLDKYAKAAGIGWEMGPLAQTENGAKPITPFMASWASHWQPISPSQSYVMLHRLRADRIARYRKLGFDVNTFTLDDVKLWLRVSDYPPVARDYLAAIAYQPLRLSDIRNAYMMDSKDSIWAQDQLQDRGLHPDDAKDAVDTWTDQKVEEGHITPRTLRRINKRRKVSAIEAMANELVNAYQTGIIDRAGTLQQLTATGYDEEAAGMRLDRADIRRRIALVKQAITRIRGDLIEGAISPEGAFEQLGQAGIQGDKANDYVRLWGIELTRDRRAASTANTIRWYRDGLLTREQAFDRLTNIGWSNPDALLHLAQAQIQDDAIEARKQAAEIKSRRQQAKEMEGVIKQGEQRTKQARAALKSLTSVPTLVRWLKRAIINADYFIRRMRLIGYSDPEINRYLDDAGLDAIGEVAKAEAKAAKESGGNNPPALEDKSNGDNQIPSGQTGPDDSPPGDAGLAGVP